MAYQTGTSSGPADLLGKLVTFATANGWAAGSPSSGAVLSKNGIVCGLFADTAEIRLRGALAASGGAWDAQTNNAGHTCICNLTAGPFPAYHFYSDAESGRQRLAAAIEISAGVFRHLLICQLIKAGTYTGGTFIAATANDPAGGNFAGSLDWSGNQYLADTNVQTANGHVHVDADGRVNSWSEIRDASDHTVTFATGCMRSQGFGYNTTFGIGYAHYNLRPIMQPIWLFQNRPSDLRSPLGYVPASRLVNLARYTVGQIDNFGGDNYQMWPAVARGSAHVENANGEFVPSSGFYGYAHLRT